MLEAPVFDSRGAYAARLGDAAYWRPYAAAALAACGLTVPTTFSSGFEGTYPTLLGDRLVVKLFGWFPGWRKSFETEVAANRAVEQVDGLSAPRVLAAGSLFPGADDDWPFLVSQRLRGQAWREVDLATRTAEAIAHDLGGQIRRLHDHPTGSLQLARADWLADHGREAHDRHRAWHSLPDRLIDEIPAYLRGYRPERRCLVHGDLTEDHLFVAGSTLIGIIDWGDAMVTDPCYDLGALHLGAFAGDRRLLGQFLDGYGWSRAEGFADQALRVALMHEFDLLAPFSALAAGCSDLTSLAHHLWAPVRYPGPVGDRTTACDA